MSETSHGPDVGDIVWTDFDPTLGREQVGRRPTLVVSPEAFARNTGFVIFCPITKKVRPFPTSVVQSDHLPVTGEIPLANIRSHDMRTRLIRYAGRKVPVRIASEVRMKLGALIAI